MTEQLKTAIDEVIKLAKSEFGERVIEHIGYHVGNIYDGMWCDDTDFQSVEELKDYSSITEKDIAIATNLKEHELHYCEDNYYVMKKAFKVVNEGWKMELIQLINKQESEVQDEPIHT